MKRSRLIDPIFGFHFWMQVGGTEQGACNWYLKAIDKELIFCDGTNRGCFVEQTGVPFSGLIWVESDARLSTITHEVAHAVMHVCRVLDLDPRQADEFQAYYSGYLNKHFTKLYNRRTKKWTIKQQRSK